MVKFEISRPALETALVVVWLLIILAFAVTGSWACPEDAKRCADGSAVSRVPPACEFAPCPDSRTVPDPDPGNVMCTMEAKMCPDGSAVGRTGPDCQFAPCPGDPQKPAP